MRPDTCRARTGPDLPEYAPQKKASFDFDKAKLQYLVDNAPSERERQRLLRVAQPHAAGFLTAVPSEDDGNDNLETPQLPNRSGLPPWSSRAE